MVVRVAYCHIQFHSNLKIKSINGIGYGNVWDDRKYIYSAVLRMPKNSPCKFNSIQNLKIKSINGIEFVCVL